MTARTGARPIARHCAELTARSGTPQEPESRFTEVGAELARAIAARLSGLVGGVRLRATCSEAEPLAPDLFLERVGDLAANSVFKFAAPGAHVIVSIPLRDLLALTDRVFGGAGDVPEALPTELPLTADLVASQVEGLLADSFESVLTPFARPDIDSRNADMARLKPFAALTECRTFALNISDPGVAEWTILIALCPNSFSSLFAAKPTVAAAPVKRDPLVGPFADLPLALAAVVAEFTLPLSKLTGLEPGDTIPLALSREVPLKILETTIAYGSVGAADERVALQLTRVF